MKFRNTFSAGFVIAAGVMIMSQQSAFANPPIANLAGTQQCSMCHLPAQEGVMPADKPPHGGFNPDGYRIWQLLQNGDQTCAASTNRAECAITTVWPSGVPSSPSTWRASNNSNNNGNNNGNNNNWNGQGSNNPPSNFQYILSKFTADCGSDKTYVTIRVHGQSGNNISFMIEHGHKVHMYIPDDSTQTSRCGGWPGRNAQFRQVANN